MELTVVLADVQIALGVMPKAGHQYTSPEKLELTDFSVTAGTHRLQIEKPCCLYQRLRESCPCDVIYSFHYQGTVLLMKTVCVLYGTPITYYWDSIYSTTG